MDDRQLRSTLQSTGMQFFINVYERANAKGGELSQQDVAECNPGKEYTAHSVSTRRSCVKRIFRFGRQREALEICQEVRGTWWGYHKQGRI